jgi:hypothetical protein
MLTNFHDELKLVAIFTSITVLPQILAYLLSAPSGSATAPRYVRRIQQLAAWSLIKFVAGLGGLSAALLFVTVRGVDNDDFAKGALIGAAFWLAFFYLGIGDAFRFLSRKYATGGDQPSFQSALFFLFISGAHAMCPNNLRGVLPVRH